MEKAILKTLAYSDIFDYPLTVFEIHKWLIGKKIDLWKVEKALEKLRVKGKGVRVKDYYFLVGRNGIVKKRILREKQSAKFVFKARFCVWFLKVIPWIKLVGISGGLAMDNADKGDDIDLFIITSKNRLWLSRLLAIGILDFLGVRRKAKMKIGQVAGKLCANILVEEDKLEQENKDIFTAHEVLQMKVLWSRDGIYSKYLTNNEWAFKFLPNWVGEQVQSAKFKVQSDNSKFKVFDLVENLAKWFQMKVMRKPQGMERIEDGALYFHPNDNRPKVLEIYRQKVKNVISP